MSVSSGKGKGKFAQSKNVSFSRRAWSKSHGKDSWGKSQGYYRGSSSRLQHKLAGFHCGDLLVEALVLLRLMIIRLGLGLGTNTQVLQVLKKHGLKSGMRTELTPSHLRKSGVARCDAHTLLCRNQCL